MSYIAGDFWRICDRCGFRYRASQTFQTWDGLYVCRDDFETRHPQDFVRGTRDNQVVPHARPEPLTSIIGPLSSTLTVALVAGDTTLNLASSVRFLAGDRIALLLDNGDSEQHYINTVPTATSITVTLAVTGPAAIGNIVIDYSAVSIADIG